MMENHQTITPLDGPNNRDSPERCPRPLYTQDSTEENHRTPQEDQGEGLADMKVEEETYVRGDQQCKEEEIPTDISTDMSSDERIFWTGFIVLYRQYECLWHVKSATYANRALRNLAYDQLIRYSRARNSAADLNWVKKMIANFRTVFLKEHKKMVESQRTGAGTDEVYKPTLWFYDLMKFTLKQEPKKRSHSSLDPESPILIEEEASDSLDLDPVDSATPQPRPPKQRRTTRRATYVPSSSQQFFQRAEEVLLRPPDVDQAFGNYIAAEMRLMTDDQKWIFKRLVLDITFRAKGQSLVNECEILPPARRYLTNVPTPTFPHRQPIQYAPGNPPQ
ncbi:uncharacterized protein LOC135054783 [Pseudophryne corroboree]|uniref:uncharacterized protein LOC135054783 n=1 Tax=Pseudophryne corroboree TaxID=495146 RepID=UPI0030814E3F